MSEDSDLGHGHSPAAWTSVIIMLVGFTIGTVAFFLVIPWLVWVSVGIVIIGLLTGWLLSRAGYGVKGPKYVPKQVH